MAAVGFEPTPPKRLVPKTSALDRTATLPLFIVTFMKVVKSGKDPMEETYVSHIQIKSWMIRVHVAINLSLWRNRLVR